MERSGNLLRFASKTENSSLSPIQTPSGPVGHSGVQVWLEARPTLQPPVAFYIPEHAEDPSRQPENTELWAEVSVPKSGPPRPIRLGVRRGNGPITPLE